MNGLQTLKRKKQKPQHLSPPSNTKASSFEDLRAPSHCSTLCPTARGQAVRAQPLLNTPPLRMLILTHHLLRDTLHEVSMPSSTSPGHSLIESRGPSPPPQPLCSQQVGAAGQLEAARQPQAGANSQQAELRRSSQNPQAGSER